MRCILEKMIIRFAQKKSLRGKILFSYVIIVFVPTIVISIVSGYFLQQSFRSNYLVTINEAVRQTVQNIEFRKQGYDLLAIRTATDGELISRLTWEYDEMASQLNTVEYVDRSFLYTSKYLPGIDDFRIYHTDQSLVQDGQLLWKPESRLLLPGLIERVWYAETSKLPDSLNWSNAPEDKLIISHKINSRNGSELGLIYLLLDYKTVFGELFERPFNGSGELSIIDNNNTVIASSDSTKMGKNSTAVNTTWTKGMSSENLMIDGKLLIVKPLTSGWHVVAVIYLDRMEKQSKVFIYGIIVVVSFFLLVSTFLIITILKNIVWRIRKMGTRMNDISQGEFDVSVRSKDKDELGELEILFNYMSGRLGKLVEDITEANLKEKELSFRALQAQINPHFIYNSLSLLRWQALDKQDDIQIRTIDALTVFYRLALNNRMNVTTIKDELAHVEAYLMIQEMRYPGRVRLEWNIEADVKELYTIKLLLQPVVENTYLHGNITGRKNSFIRISAQIKQGTVEFEIFDNGIGIPGETLDRIRSGEQVGTGNGFGTMNIRERLRLYFGDAHELIIESKENEGTRVMIVIPVCSEKPDISIGRN